MNLIITQKQLDEGYMTMENGWITQCQWKVIQKMENGDYIVEDPRDAVRPSESEWC